MTHFIKFIFLFAASSCFVLGACTAFAQTTDSTAATKKDTLRYPIFDRRGDRFTIKKHNPFDIVDTSFIKQTILYNPKTKQYEIVEKIGSSNFRKPSYLSFDEFYYLQSKKQENDYFKLRADALTGLNQRLKRPKLTVYDKLFDRIFGVGDKIQKAINDKVSSVTKTLKNAKDSTAKRFLPQSLLLDIKPQGSVDIMAGYQGQSTLNPTLPERARSNGGFDFNMNANLQVNANIGDKLKLPINYNTLANFDYLNQLKFDYKGKDDEMLKSIEAGNISWQSKGTLMPSAQNLFGLKTSLQFGKLFVTGAIASQKSQRQNQALQGGSATTTFKKGLSDYEENRHFLLGQYFNKNYNKSMASLPVVYSQVNIQRIEVWVTNKTGATTDARTIVGLADLGEANPNNPNIQSSGSGNGYPQNGANNLYAGLNANRDPSQVVSYLQTRGLSAVNDFEKTFARKLSPNEYYFNPQIGFISLNGQLQPDEVLAVSYQYTSNGRVYQVGEFSQDVALDTTAKQSGVQKVLFVKLLKATSARTNLPIWRLMMKNVYSLDLAGVSKADFKLNVFYNQPSGGLNNYLPEASPAVDGKPLLRILNLDRLNNQSDPHPDGVFDYLEGFTILSQQGKIIFPVLEPFGRDLDSLAFNGMPQDIKAKYVYRQLYDSIKAIAQTYANLDRFVMQGKAKGTGGSEVYLGGFNIPPGSVKVSAGGQQLLEGVDFIIDYNLGTVKIINQAIVNSGVPVNVSYENNSQLGTQQRGFTALRADYIANKKLAIGASMVRLNERPFFTKVSIGEDPIRNTMYGVDVNYKSELPGLTRLLNKLPFYSTKAMSSITAYGEAAYLKPGHPSQIGSGGSGLIYVDDFEGTRSSLDLRFPLTAWALASTPQGNPKFPEATLTNDLAYGKNRAKLAWYNIEPNLQDKNSTNNPLRKNLTEISDPRVRLVYTNELFPQQTTNITNTQTTTFDVAYYPTDIGPYNYEADPLQIDANGKLRNPKNRWGGIMRAIDQTDFETNNFEFVEMWVQDPFIKNPNSTGGKLVLNFGNVSEDILKDGQRFYENGLNTPSSPASVDSGTSKWATYPVNPVQVTNAFSNNTDDRPYQDVGFDGMGNAAERRKWSDDYLKLLATNFGTNSLLYQRAFKDPSNDDYLWYRDGAFDASNTGILGRYKNYNNPQGNSSTATSGSSFASAATLYPDNEDLNRDNTLNETEEYYQYEINLKPNMLAGVDNYVTDKRAVTVRYANGTSGTENWYLLRVPLKGYTQRVGSIPDFKSIRFVRMYLTDFEDSAVLRFAKFDLVRNNWRQFTYNLDTTGSYTPVSNALTSFNTLAVNLEENSSRTPVNYVIPPGIERVQQLSNNGVNLLQNEQAMSIQVRNLHGGDARAVFKTINFDLRQYGTLDMFAHAESGVGTSLKDGDLNVVVRIGSDFLNNYYEIKIPLKVTLPGNYGSADAIKVWPAENNLNFSLQDLVQLKLRRNVNRPSLTQIYRELIGNKTVSVMGNPNLGEVSGILVGVENAKTNSVSGINAEVWVNELRLSNINETGSYAALARVDMQLADLGRLSVSGSTHSAGWGSIDQKIGERALDNFTQFDAALTIEAGKLLPKQARLSVPVYASISKTVSAPKFDPYDKDVKLSDKISAAKTTAQKDSIKAIAVDQTTIKTINFTNVRVQAKGKPHLLSISNFDVSYSYIVTEQSNPTVLQNLVKKYRAGLGYTYNNPTKYIEPFKTIIKSRKEWLAWVKGINFNLKPSLLSFRTDINRQYGQYIPRIVNTDLTTSKIQRVDTTFDKYFTFDRFYNLRWDFTRSLNFDFTATNNARVDEPDGAINTKEKKDTLWRNFFNGGRTTQYSQKANFSYSLPLTKFPLTNWITARYSYGTFYNWIAASRLAVYLGNTLENGQDNNLNAEFDFSRLYNKSRFLRALDMGANKQPKNVPNNGFPPTVKNTNPLGITIKTRDEVIKNPVTNQYLHGKEKRLALKKWRQQKRDARTAARLQKSNEPIELNEAEVVAGRLITSLKRVSVNYTESFNSRVPGYMDSTQFIGQNFKSMQPGLDYVFGKQPDTAWLNQKSAKGLITRDSNYNSYYRQNFTQKLSITAQLEPVRELLIDVNFDKSFSKDYSELFKDTLNNGSRQQHLSPYAAGGFSVSYISCATLFRSSNPNEVSRTFKRFENYRRIISQRVAQTNGYWQALGTGQQYNADGFAKGYNRYSQDVLIPAFLAAYTDKDPTTIGLLNQNNKNIRSNPFNGVLPRPNWRMTYTGLSKLAPFKSFLSNITITHAYSGTLNMNSYASALNYYDTSRLSAPSFIDTISGNYVPYFLLPNLTMQESFSPLIGIDITTSRQLNIKFEYKRSRQLSLSLVDYQLSETNSTEWTIGAAWRKKGIVLPFKLPFTKSAKLDNDLSIKVDVSMRNDATTNSRLDQANAYGTGGQRVITIQPSIDYVLSKRINLKLFFDQRRTTPYISTSAPTITTRGGLQVRVSLAP